MNAKKFNSPIRFCVRFSNGSTELVIVRETLTKLMDNAHPHSANYTRQVIAENHVATLECPSRSPDLSPIEHVWDILGRRIYARNDGNNVMLHCSRNGSKFHWSRSTN